MEREIIKSRGLHKHLFWIKWRYCRLDIVLSHFPEPPPPQTNLITVITLKRDIRPAFPFFLIHSIFHPPSSAFNPPPLPVQRLIFMTGVKTMVTQSGGWELREWEVGEVIGIKASPVTFLGCVKVKWIQKKQSP